MSLKTQNPKDGANALKNDNPSIFDLITADQVSSTQFEDFNSAIFDHLKRQDRFVYDLIEKEFHRQQNTIQLIAAENQCSPAVLAALGSVVQDKTTEGFVGARFHGGSEVVDQIEDLAVERAIKAFGAKYANVQPHSGTAANQIILSAILDRDDRVLSLALDQGGHLSHGANVSFSGKFFNIENYYVDRNTFLLDYDRIEEQANRFRPKLIICGATAYARAIDFARFRQIADSVGAYLLADISHISSLVMAAAHQSPVNHAHFTTTSTYKPGGPRGGLIIMGRDYENKITVGSKKLPLWKHIQKTTFPGVQGTPYLNHIAAKAVFFNETMTEQYRDRQFRIIENAKSLAHNLIQLGYDVLTGGTDNHMVLINVANSLPEMTGVIAQKALEDCGIIVNMNRLPFEEKPASITSGMRLGTPIVTKIGMGTAQMKVISELIDNILRQVRPITQSQYQLNDSLRDDVLDTVRAICERFRSR